MSSQTGPLLQPRLIVSQPGDHNEREADCVAEQVMRMPAPRLPYQRSAEATEEKMVQRKVEVQRQIGDTGNMVEAPSVVHEVLRLPGQPLDPATRQFMETRFGHDFSQVRVHADARANRSSELLSANAYTVGNNVIFGNGQYRPETSTGRRLIAHELTHVIQQVGNNPNELTAVSNILVQRQNDAGLPPGGIPGTPESTASSSEATELQAPPAPLSEIRSTATGRVQQIVISCNDMLIRLDTATTANYYRLETCHLAPGSYETLVTVTGNDFFLDFGAAAEHGEEFYFTYRVEQGQENPADLLRRQTNVHVDVVDFLPGPQEARRADEERQTPQCIRIDDRELVPADSLTRNLFNPITLEPTSIWSRRIPLGQFGWVLVEATVSGNLSGRLFAHYGPGRLTDICLTHLIDRESSSAAIDHPLLGPQSRTDVTTYGIGGRARFTLPARASIRVMGEGRLKIAGDYLDVIEVAAAEGILTAEGEATLTGEINGAVEVLALATRAAATLDHPLSPLQVTIENSTIDAVDLAAEIGLRGRAGLMFQVALSASFDVAGFNLWSQTWRPTPFMAGVSWSGGLKYSPNPGIHWNLGILDVDDTDYGPAEDERLEDILFQEESAEVDEQDFFKAILDEEHAQVSTPDGLSQESALPFDWHKPLELYPRRVGIPNADDPKVLTRDDGPTIIRYQSAGRTVYETIGVDSQNWPYQQKKFQYIPYATREEPEKNRLRRLFDRLGYDRTGTDVDHVHELQFGGADHFENLWPADNSGNRSAGRRHLSQLQNYERQLGNLAGRWFVISRIRI
jgi:hypothetical protein